MAGKKSRAKATVQAPGDLQSPPKPAIPPRSTHEPTQQVVDEYVKVVGVDNVAGPGIQVLDCAVLANEVKGLPSISEDVWSVRERLQKLQQEKGEPLEYMLRVNPQAGPAAFTKGVLSKFPLGLYHWLSPALMEIILHFSAETLTALFAMMQRVQGPQRQYVLVYNVADADQKRGPRPPTDVVKPPQAETLRIAPRYGHTHFLSGVQISGFIGLRGGSVRWSARDLERTSHP